MPVTTIPLDQTASLADLDNIYDSTTPSTDLAAAPPLIDNDLLIVERQSQYDPGNSDPVLEEGTFNLELFQLKRYLQGSNATIKRWQPNTNYLTSYTELGVDYPADILFHNNQVFLVLADFDSGLTFSEKVNEVVVLSRLTKDSDKEHLEITATATAPIFTDQIIAMYPTIRPFKLYAQHTLANDRVSAPATLHVAYCNGDIATENVITIQRYSDAVGWIDVGTITFTPAVATTVLNGVVYFNDVSQGALALEQVAFARGDLLVLRTDTVSVDIEFMAINLLGTFINYMDADYDGSYVGGV